MGKPAAPLPEGEAVTTPVAGPAVGRPHVAVTVTFGSPRPAHVVGAGGIGVVTMRPPRAPVPVPGPPETGTGRPYAVVALLPAPTLVPIPKSPPLRRLPRHASETGVGLDGTFPPSTFSRRGTDPPTATDIAVVGVVSPPDVPTDDDVPLRPAADPVTDREVATTALAPHVPAGIVAALNVRLVLNVAARAVVRRRLVGAGDAETRPTLAAQGRLVSDLWSTPAPPGTIPIKLRHGLHRTPPVCGLLATA